MHPFKRPQIFAGRTLRIFIPAINKGTIAFFHGICLIIVSKAPLAFEDIEEKKKDSDGWKYADCVLVKVPK